MGFWHMVRRLGGLVGLRVVGAGLGFLTQIILARLFLPSDVGLIFTAMSGAVLLTFFITAGFPALNLVTVPRLISQPGSSRSLPAFHGAALRVLALPWALSLVGAAVAYGQLPPGSAARVLLVYGALVSIPGIFIIHNSATANGLSRFTLSYLPDFVLRPGLLLLLLGGALALGLPMPWWGVLGLALLAALLVAAVQAVLMGKDGLSLRHWASARPAYTRALLPRALSLLLVALVAGAFTDLITLLAGLLLPPDQVALVAVAVRLAAISAFVVQAAQQMVLPDAAAALVRRDHQTLDRLLWRMNLLTITTMLAGLLGAALLGRWVLGFFGPTYPAAYGLLLVFMAGQTLRALSGLNQHLLALAGHQSQTAFACLAAVVVVLAAALLLTPRLGAMGLGLAVIAAEIVWLSGLARKARKLVGRRADMLWLAQRHGPAE